MAARVRGEATTGEPRLRVAGRRDAGSRSGRSSATQVLVQELMRCYIIGAGPGDPEAHHRQRRRAHRALPGRLLHGLARARGGHRARSQRRQGARLLGHDARRNRRRHRRRARRQPGRRARAHRRSVGLRLDGGADAAPARARHRVRDRARRVVVLGGGGGHRQRADPARAVSDGHPDARRRADADAARREARGSGASPGDPLPVPVASR